MYMFVIVNIIKYIQFFLAESTSPRSSMEPTSKSSLLLLTCSIPGLVKEIKSNLSINISQIVHEFSIFIM